MSAGTPGAWQERDGRREPRVPVELDAALGGRSPRAARLIDLSLNGCLLRSAAALDPGAVVDLRFELPDGTLRTKARVAEASVDGDSLPGDEPSFLAGLEFLGLAAADELRLRAFVAEQARRRRSAHTPPA